MYQQKQNIMALAKILHEEFNVFQFVTEENKVYRIYEMKNGTVLGVKNMKTKVITPIQENKEYSKLYEKWRNKEIIN